MTRVKELTYHGVKPPTKEDAKLATSHLDRTMKLEKTKIKEHQKQKSVAQKSGNNRSVKYNESHIKDHKSDLKERSESKKTIQKIWEKLESLRSKK